MSGSFNAPPAGHDAAGTNAAAMPARWAAVSSLTLGVFGLVTAEFLPVSLLTPISADLAITPGAAGQSITTTAIIAAFAGPGIVIGTRSLDRRWTVLALTALLVVSTLLAAAANGLAVLLAARVLLGIALGGFWAMSAALTMRLVPSDKFARAMAIVMTGVSVATVCAAPLGAWIGATLGWRAAFLLASGLGVLALVIQAATLPAMPPAGHAGLGTMAALLRRPAIRIGLASTLLIVAGHFAGFTYVRPFLERVPHLDVEAISLILLGYGVAGFVGNFLGGAVSARSPRLSISVWASLTAAAAVVMAVAGRDPTVSAVAVTAWGLAFGALPVSIQSYVNRAAPDEAESAGALMITTFQVAISSGAMLGGILIQSLGPVSVITFLAIASLLGASVMAGRREGRVLSQG